MMEALPLLRVASGSTQNEQVDRAWMQSLLKSIGADGMVYVLLKGRPWSLINVPVNYMQPIWKSDGAKTDLKNRSVSQVTCPWYCQRAISAIAIYYLRDGNPMWKAA